MNASDAQTQATVEQQRAMEAQYEDAHKKLIDYVFNVYLYLQEMDLVPVIDGISPEDSQIKHLLGQGNMYVSELVHHFN